MLFVVVGIAMKDGETISNDMLILLAVLVTGFLPVGFGLVSLLAGSAVPVQILRALIGYASVIVIAIMIVGFAGGVYSGFTTPLPGKAASKVLVLT